LLTHLERRPLLEELIEFVIESRGLAVLNKLEGRVVIFGCNRHVPTFLYVVEHTCHCDVRGNYVGADQKRHFEYAGETCEASVLAHLTLPSARIFRAGPSQQHTEFTAPNNTDL